MSRLGKKQIYLLKFMANVGCALVVPNDISRSLCKRGLMEATGGLAEDAFIVVTPNGLRALADAMDAGLVSYRPDWEKIKARTVEAKGISASHGEGQGR